MSGISGQLGGLFELPTCRQYVARFILSLAPLRDAQFGEGRIAMYYKYLILAQIRPPIIDLSQPLFIVTMQTGQPVSQARSGNIERNDQLFGLHGLGRLRYQVSTDEELGRITETVIIHQKVRLHTPFHRRLDCFINMLVGGTGVVEVNT